MKDYLAELVRASPTPAQARNAMREYLQARILGALQRAGAMIPLAFHGGTALRFLYATARYSEDLDFALEKDRDRKGRDLYDLMWYLSDPNWPAPNLTLLNNALQQTGWKGKPLTEENWRDAVRERLQTVAWEQVVDDVRPFLESSADPNLLTRENSMQLLE